VQEEPNGIAEQAEPPQRLQPPKGTDQQQQLRSPIAPSRIMLPGLNNTLNQMELPSVAHSLRVGRGTRRLMNIT
jgi:hypothetical protein